MASLTALFAVLSLSLLLSNAPCHAHLSPTYYKDSCPKAVETIRTIVRQAVSAERRMAASLIRLHFHDCFVQGCDGSILLDQAPNIDSEQAAFPNVNSVRGFNVVEAAKRAVEKLCPRVVSCADILTLAARDSSVAVGGPTWEVKLGRKDSTTASRTLANTDLPGPFSDVNTLIRSFAAKGLNTRDMVALSGSHTLGQSQCFLFRERIYNGTNINRNFATMRQGQCPRTGEDSRLSPLDLVTPNSFDNNYFKNLIQQKGLLQSDQVLFSRGPTDSLVIEYSKSPEAFAADFATAMVKMSEIQLLLGKKGTVRRVCSAVN